MWLAVVVGEVFRSDSGETKKCTALAVHFRLLSEAKTGRAKRGLGGKKRSVCPLKKDIYPCLIYLRIFFFLNSVYWNAKKHKKTDKNTKKRIKTQKNGFNTFF